MKKLIKRLSLWLLAFSVIVGAAAIWVTNPVLGSVPAYSGDIPVDSNLLRTDVEVLAASEPARNIYNVEALDATAAYLRQRLESFGYTVTDQSYQLGNNTYKNVLCHYGPEDAERLVIGAHYDVCEDQQGADDNASGVAGVLEIARLLQLKQPTLDYRIDLVLFTLEEPPTFRSAGMGSYVHAQSLRKEGIKVKGMLCLEMIGYFTDAPNSQQYPAGIMKAAYPSQGNFIAVVGTNGQHDFTKTVKIGMMSACAVNVVSINAPKGMRGIDFSDHQNYWEEGWDAVMITDTAFFRNKNYHQPTDTPDTLDYGRMAEVVKGVYVAATAM